MQRGGGSNTHDTRNPTKTNQQQQQHRSEPSRGAFFESVFSRCFRPSLLSLISLSPSRISRSLARSMAAEPVIGALWSDSDDEVDDNELRFIHHGVIDREQHLHDGSSVLLAGAQRHEPSRVQIECRDAPTPAEFARVYRHKRPVKLSNIASAWPAIGTWQEPEYLIGKVCSLCCSLSLLSQRQHHDHTTRSRTGASRSRGEPARIHRQPALLQEGAVHRTARELRRCAARRGGHRPHGPQGAALVHASAAARHAAGRYLGASAHDQRSRRSIGTG